MTGVSRRVSARLGPGRGFTLPELSLALLVSAIVATAAVANLRPALQHSRRAAAVAALLELNLQQQRHHALHGGYADSLQALDWQGYAPAGYVLRVQVRPDQESGFVLQAHPEGTQRSDRCGMLSLDDLGRREAAAQGCW